MCCNFLVWPHPSSIDRDGTMTIDWTEWRDHSLNLINSQEYPNITMTQFHHALTTVLRFCKKKIKYFANEMLLIQFW